MIYYFIDFPFHWWRQFAMMLHELQLCGGAASGVSSNARRRSQNKVLSFWVKWFCQFMVHLCIIIICGGCVDLPASHLVFKFWRFDYIWRMGFVIGDYGEKEKVWERAYGLQWTLLEDDKTRELIGACSCGNDWQCLNGQETLMKWSLLNYYYRLTNPP